VRFGDHGPYGNQKKVMRTHSRKQKAIAEINITPFTDVILVLLVIFMITTPLIMQSTIKVNLPNARSAKTVNNASQKVNIVIDKKGSIYLDDKAVSKDELRARIELMYKDSPDLEVALLSDRLSKFKDIVSVLDVMNEVGIKNLNIATRLEPSDRIK
jgi:TonB system transport protein ExbD (group 2)